jgi:hypothetical protein
MKAIQQEELPLTSEAKEFVIDESLVGQFNDCFKHQGKGRPPTLGVKSLTAMFDILNALEVDWKQLLHINQSFDYLKDFALPMPVTSQVQLVKHRFRAGGHWLQFETEIKEKESGDLLIRSRSMVMVAETQ